MRYVMPTYALNKCYEVQHGLFCELLASRFRVYGKYGGVKIQLELVSGCFDLHDSLAATGLV